MPPARLCTRESIAADLDSLGVQAGDTIVLHSSVNKIGFVNGGPVTVVQAILDVLGPNGTLVVPTHTIDNTDPSTWAPPDYVPVPEEWWQAIRDSMPVYDAAVTPSRRMGAVPEVVRTWPGAKRSGHPQTSFAAVGSKAASITDNHAITCRMGEDSPLARLEGIGAKILLIGVDFGKCTAFHLAEYRADYSPIVECSFAIMSDGKRVWRTLKDRKWDGKDFAQIGEDFCAAKKELVQQGQVGSAHCSLVPLKDSLQFATNWLSNKKQKMASS